MILVFVDETSDTKFKDYFGLSCAMVKHNFYRQVKNGFQEALLNGGWDPSIEFKGLYLFSASKGCQDVSIEKRVEIAEKIIDLNAAKKNARMSFAYFHKESRDEKADYLFYLPALLHRMLPKAFKGQGKDLVSVQCDYRSDISVSEIREVVTPPLMEKGYTLFEDVVQVNSNFDTVGIAYADIVGYLMGRVETISNDSELFDNIPPELFATNGKIRKLKSSLRLIDKIKNLTLYKVQV